MSDEPEEKVRKKSIFDNFIKQTTESLIKTELNSARSSTKSQDFSSNTSNKSQPVSTNNIDTEDIEDDMEESYESTNILDLVLQQQKLNEQFISERLTTKKESPLSSQIKDCTPSIEIDKESNDSIDPKIVPQDVTNTPEKEKKLNPENSQSPGFNEWEEYIDEETGYAFEYNTMTGETRWKQFDDSWQAFYDHDGNLYYYNSVSIKFSLLMFI